MVSPLGSHPWHLFPLNTNHTNEDFTLMTSFNLAATAAKSLQSCPTLCNPIDGNPPGSPIPGILQARILEWVAISFSNAWKWKWKWSHSVMSNSFRLHGLQPTRLLCPWNFPGKGTGVGCHYPFKGPVSKYSHVGSWASTYGWGWGGGDRHQLALNRATEN